MPPRKLALIGHSGSGKSEAIRLLGIDKHLAEMDCALGTGTKVPTLTEALTWLTDGTEGQSVVVVSNHEEMLGAMLRAKQAGECADRFAQLFLVYLCKPLDRLQRHLGRLTAAGDRRPVSCQQ